MDTPPLTYALRPLGIGEMLDRAVTMYVKNAVIFTALILVVFAPIAAVQSLNASTQVDQFTTSLSILQHIGDAKKSSPSPQQTNDLKKIEAQQPTVLLIAGIVFLLALFLSPVGTGAIAVGVHRLYRGEPLKFGDCFMAGLRRLPAMIGIGFIAFFALLIWYIATILIAVVVAIPGAMLIKSALPLAIVFFVLAGIAILAAFLFLIVLILAFGFAYIALLVEKATVGAAIGSGFKRIINRKEIWRSLLFALAIAGVQIGGSSVIAMIALLMLLVLHSAILYIIVAAIINAVLSSFVTIFVVIYYFDVRIRLEGTNGIFPVAPAAVAI